MSGGDTQGPLNICCTHQHTISMYDIAVGMYHVLLLLLTDPYTLCYIYIHIFIYKTHVAIVGRTHEGSVKASLGD